MKLPKTTKGRLKLLIQIAESLSDPSGVLDDDDFYKVGSMTAGIQNDLGDMAKFGLEYTGEIKE